MGGRDLWQQPARLGGTAEQPHRNTEQRTAQGVFKREWRPDHQARIRHLFFQLGMGWGSSGREFQHFVGLFSVLGQPLKTPLLFVLILTKKCPVCVKNWNAGGSCEIRNEGTEYNSFKLIKLRIKQAI